MHSKEPKHSKKKQIRHARRFSENSTCVRNTKVESVTDVNFSTSEVNSGRKQSVAYPQSVLSGIRKPVGIRVDTGLYGEFKRVSKARMGSVCAAIECFMVAFLGLESRGVNFGETVKIEHFNVLRSLRPRRHLAVAEQEPVVLSNADTNAHAGKPCCDFRTCDGNPIVATFQDRTSGIEKAVCCRHAQELRGHPKWKELKLFHRGEKTR